MLQLIVLAPACAWEFAVFLSYKAGNFLQSEMYQ